MNLFISLAAVQVALFWQSRQDLRTLTKRIMSKISDFATAVQANFDKVSADLDSIKTEIADLNAQIQNANPADQAALDSIQAASAALAAKADALVIPPVPAP